MSGCLDNTQCRAIAEQLTDKAADWWTTNSPHVRSLAREELTAMSRAMAAGRAEASVALLVAWRDRDRASWTAWRDGTTDQLRGVAKRRAEARALLLDALSEASGVVLRIVGAAIRGALGL